MKNKRIIIYFLFIFGAMLPALSYADEYIGSDKPRDQSFQLVPCDGVDVPCDFNALMTMVNRFINFIFYISIPLAAISFSYAGYLYLSAAGDTGKITEAHKIFYKVLIGFIFVSAAWLIVYTIQKALLSSDFNKSNANLLRGGGSGGNVSGGSGNGTETTDSGYDFSTSGSEPEYNEGTYNDGANYIEGTKNPFDMPTLDTSGTENSVPKKDNSNTDYVETENPLFYRPNLTY